MKYRKAVALDDTFERRARELQAKTAGAAPLQTYPAPEGWWTRSPNIGQSVSFNPGTDNRQSVVKMPAMGIPRVWTLMLGATWKPTASQFFDVTAEIQIGSGASIVTVQVDWANGTALSFCADAVTVNAVYSESSIVTLAVPDTLVLTAELGIGSRGSSGLPPTKSFRRQVILNGNNSAIMQVPPFARSVRLLGDVNTYNASNLLTGYANPIATFPIFNLPTNLFGPQDEIMIPGLAKYLQFTNASGGTTALNTVFQIQL